MILDRLLTLVGFIAISSPGVWAQPATDIAGGTQSATTTPDAGLLERVVILGSSASDGFNTPATLNLLFEPMITTEHEPVLSAATSYFFLAAEQTGEQLAAKAKSHDPTLVIALDYLFWFGYGNLPSERARLLLLEQGLENLERFDCPVVVSPFPVVPLAVGTMLSPAQVPAEATLQLLDARIEEWVAQTSGAYIVSVPQIYAQLMKQPPGKIAGQTWPLAEDTKLMQDDALHPTVEGMAAIAALILQDLVRQDLIPANSVDVDLAACLAEASEGASDEPAPRTTEAAADTRATDR